MAMKRLKMSNSREIRRTINKIANLVLNGETDAKTANCVLYACNIALSAVRMDDLESRLTELEHLVEENDG